MKIDLFMTSFLKCFEIFGNLWIRAYFIGKNEQIRANNSGYMSESVILLSMLKKS